MVRRILVTLTVIGTFFPGSAFAEVGLTQIVQGSTGKEVMALVGEPKERIENETRRELVWIYPTGSVVFVGGRARSVYMKGSNQDRFSEAYRRSVEMAKPAVSKAPSSPVEDILTEILKEVPSEGGPEGGASSELKPVEIH